VIGNLWIALGSLVIATIVVITIAVHPDAGPDAFLGGWFVIGLMAMVAVPAAALASAIGVWMNVLQWRREPATRTIARAVITAWGILLGILLLSLMSVFLATESR
jgi:hypothetical protein